MLEYSAENGIVNGDPILQDCGLQSAYKSKENYWVSKHAADLLLMKALSYMIKMVFYQ